MKKEANNSKALQEINKRRGKKKIDAQKADRGHRKGDHASGSDENPDQSGGRAPFGQGRELGRDNASAFQQSACGNQVYPDGEYGRYDAKAGENLREQRNHLRLAVGNVLKFFGIKGEAAVDLDVELHRLLNILFNQLPGSYGKLHASVNKIKSDCAHQDKRRQKDDPFDGEAILGGPGHQDSGEPGRCQGRHRHNRMRGLQNDDHNAKTGKKGDERFPWIVEETQDVQNQREKQQENESGKGKQGGRQKKRDGEQPS